MKALPHRQLGTCTDLSSQDHKFRLQYQAIPGGYPSNGLFVNGSAPVVDG
jgi:hypothetical protein